MLNVVAALSRAIPEVALFSALAFGQLGVVLDAHVKTVFFALFIFVLLPAPVPVLVSLLAGMVRPH